MLQPISLDISAAVATVLGVLPVVNALRDQIVKEVPAFDVARFDKLEDYALALNFAHARYLSATQPPDDLDAVSEQATKARGRLLAEAKALVLDGVLSDAQLRQLKGANGYKKVATDLGGAEQPAARGMAANPGQNSSRRAGSGRRVWGQGSRKSKRVLASAAGPVNLPTAAVRESFSSSPDAVTAGLPNGFLREPAVLWASAPVSDGTR